MSKYSDNSKTFQRMNGRGGLARLEIKLLILCTLIILLEVSMVSSLEEISSVTLNSSLGTNYTTNYLSATPIGITPNVTNVSYQWYKDGAAFIEPYWNVTNGGDGTEINGSIVVDSFGNIYVAGTTDSYGEGGNSFWILKLDQNGKVLWNTAVGGSEDEQAYDIALDSLNNVYVTGYTYSYGAGGKDIYLVKLNSVGQLVWNKTFGRENDEFGYGLAIDSSDNIHIGATAESFGGVDLDYMWTIKLDSDGNQIWNATFGGANGDYGYGIALNSADELYVGGYTSSFGAERNEFVILKYDGDGGIQWNVTTNEESSGVNTGIAIDLSDNIYVLGYGPVGEETKDIYLLKFDSNGNRNWETNLETTGDDAAYSIAIDSVQNIFVAGKTNFQSKGGDDLWIIKFNSTGKHIWNTSFGKDNDDCAYDLAFDSSNNIYLAGKIFPSEAENSDLIIIKYKYGGNILESEFTTINDSWSVQATPYDLTNIGINVMSNNLTIVPDITAPVLESIENQRVNYNNSFEHQITASDEDAIDSWSLNDNINFSINETGYITNNTELSLTTYQLTIIVNDTGNNENNISFNVSVGDLQTKNITANSSTNFNFSVFSTDLDIYLSDNTSTTAFVTESSVISEETISDLSSVRGIDIFVDNTTNQLLTWAIIKIHYLDSEISEIDESSLRIYYYNETSHNWQLETNQGINIDNNYVWVNVTHFSSFEIFGNIFEISETISSGGSRRSSISPEICNSDWKCSAWDKCSDDGEKTRICIDKSECANPTDKPTETKKCQIIFKEIETPSKEIVVEEQKEQKNKIPKKLFDISFSLDDNFLTNSSKLTAVVSFESFGSEPTPVNLIFTVRDETGHEIYRTYENITVQTEEIVRKTFDKLNLTEGKYTIFLHTIYSDNVFDEFKQDFEIKYQIYGFDRLIHWIEGVGKFYLIGFFVIMVLISVASYFRHRRFKKDEFNENFTIEVPAPKEEIKPPEQ